MRKAINELSFNLLWDWWHIFLTGQKNYIRWDIWCQTLISTSLSPPKLPTPAHPVSVSNTQAEVQLLVSEYERRVSGCERILKTALPVGIQRWVEDSMKHSFNYLTRFIALHLLQKQLAAQPALHFLWISSTIPMATIGTLKHVLAECWSQCTVSENQD